MKLVISLTTDANVVQATLSTSITSANLPRVLAAWRARLIDPSAVPAKTDAEVFQAWASTVVNRLKEDVRRYEVEQAAPSDAF